MGKKKHERYEIIHCREKKEKGGGGEGGEKKEGKEETKDS